MKRIEDKNQPWVSNYPPLDAWLKEQEAVCNWQLQRGKAPHITMIECWSLNGHVFLLEVRSNQNGWNIYTAHPSNNIASTLDDACLRCSR